MSVPGPLTGRAVRSVLDPVMNAKLATVQVLEDAIAWRAGQLDGPCPQCPPGSQCEPHEQDIWLLEGYRGQFTAALRDALDGADQADIGRVFGDGPGGEAGSITSHVMIVMVLAVLRRLAADGPVVMELHGEMVLVELRDGRVAVHPVGPGSPPGPGPGTGGVVL